MAESEKGKRFPRNIGIAADHGGFELKNHFVRMLQESGYVITDFGAKNLKEDDDYPDYIIPLAQAVSAGKIDRGIAICGSGVGACVVANKFSNVRASLITETYSAHQGVEHDDMNVICMGGRVTGIALADELVRVFLTASYNGAERHQRRLNKIKAIENSNKQ
ncbi:MAG: RpiB/LacA/LacB family sugar-phosphate isomerase [Syntrophothermus sp.]